jgi:hypothetical protein
LNVSASAADRLFRVRFVVLVEVSLAVVVAGFHRHDPSLLQQLEAALDGVQSPHHVGFEANQDLGRVLVGAAPDLGGLHLSLADDLLAQLFGLPRELAFLDEIRGLFLGPRQNLLGFFTSLFEKTFDLVGDPSRGPYLFGDSHPELVDPLERLGLVDEHAAAERNPPAVRNERFEPLDQDDDVYRTGPPWADRQGCRLGRL